MKSRVHPKYKTKYHVGNWPEYERALVRRGDVTFLLSADAIDAWTPAPSGGVVATPTDDTKPSNAAGASATNTVGRGQT